MITKIVKIKNEYVYPIFKNGSSTIEKFVKEGNYKYLINEQCKRAKKITVYVRNPINRFVSGVNTFIQLEKKLYKRIDEKTIIHLIGTKKLHNEHFEEQFFWLQRLYKFCNPIVKLKNLEELNLPVTNKSKVIKNKKEILKIYNCPHDEVIYNRYLDKEVLLSELLKEVGNAVS
jgi:hypothetical protein